MDSQEVNILTLPEDVIIPIFQFLPQFEVLHNIRLTCKAWNHYSRHGILWRRIRAQDFIRATFRIENFMRFLCDISHLVEEIVFDVEQIKHLQKNQFFFSRLRSLKIDKAHGRLDSDKLSEYSLKAITRLYPALKVLHLKYFCFDFDMTCCPSDLKELVVAGWILGERSKYKHPRNVGEHFMNLTHLGLLRCQLINQTVLALLSGLPCLESIDLSSTKYDHYLKDDEKIPDKHCSRRIQKVVLNNMDCEFFPHVFVYILVSARESIRYIDISNSNQGNLTSPCLHNIAEMCEQLDTLVIGNHDFYNEYLDKACFRLLGPDVNRLNRGIRDVASKNQHLSTIKMNFVEANIDDETVLHVFQNCTKLQWIEILGCESLSDNTLGSISNGERLHVIKISKCKYVTPAGIGKALQRCSRLRTLHVEDIGTIKHILDRKNFRIINYLTTLSLANCYELSDECLDQIAICCPILRSINLTCCHGITDVGFVQFVQQCASITEIILNDNQEYKIGLTDHAFSEVANFRNNLERLTLGRFSKITNEAIHELICKCPKLTKILFCNTDRLWEFDVVITASKLDMTKAEILEFTQTLRRELEKLHIEQEDVCLSGFVSAIRLHRDCLSRRNKDKLFTDWDEASLPMD
ncbi:uncharacterized protein LOC127872983 [Dreissena polymorpha]|uniref:F-box domain-containing protein n=1 Tax=Dreissena polymorpha TaxID=45954 RepID=A0A9D4KSM4_DREPO|nr:uncharacterized protein LOC127872983 [Dreissena polymorpha]KAH3845080.1 hypothetical protein DPMN_087350 [Dreissena polymorpha]